MTKKELTGVQDIISIGRDRLFIRGEYIGNWKKYQIPSPARSKLKIFSILDDHPCCIDFEFKPFGSKINFFKIDFPSDQPLTSIQWLDNLWFKISAEAMKPWKLASPQINVHISEPQHPLTAGTRIKRPSVALLLAHQAIKLELVSWHKCNNPPAYAYSTLLPRLIALIGEDYSALTQPM